MNKILVGILAGAVLGAIDGLTAWFTPQVRDQMLSIVIGSTAKGIIAGIAAGWYARRVQSVPKGIVFGFVVGLILAFAIAAMPDPKTGEHYWWQIMLPGSVLGGVIGFATQQYGRRPSRAAAAALLALALFVPSANALAHDGHAAAPQSNPVFEKLKGMEGTWSATTMSLDGTPTTVVYRVTGGGSVVMETMFAGEPHEMINMYTLNGDELVATHYCSAGNQPHLRYNAEKSTADDAVFDLVNLTGTKTPSYINGVTISFGKDGRVRETWTSSGESQPVLLFLNARK
jgi:hypothetical protein